MFSNTIFCVLIAALLASASSARAATETVTIKDFDYAPMTMSVVAGTTVVWKNLDGEPHTVVSSDGLFRSPALDQNDSYSFTFAKAGTYRYVCSIHPKMIATITVH